MYQVYFISHSESNAETNFRQLQRLVPSQRLSRVHKHGGCVQSHVAAAVDSPTDYFFTVDGDNFITDADVFNYQVTEHSQSARMWSLINPALGIATSYGAVKLFPKKLFLQRYVDEAEQLADVIDPFGVELRMATIYYENHVIGSTVFFKTPREAFGSAFRETVKQHYYWKIVDPNYREKAQAWIAKWKSPVPRCENSWHLELGAVLGDLYGRKCSQLHQFKLANDYEWLQELNSMVTVELHPRTQAN